MSKKAKTGLRIALMNALIALMPMPSFARCVPTDDSGTVVCVFLIIGAVIVILQFLTTAIIFFCIVGVACTLVFKRHPKKAIA
jgi:hypothetical protein